MLTSTSISPETATVLQCVKGERERDDRKRRGRKGKGGEGRERENIWVSTHALHATERDAYAVLIELYVLAGTGDFPYGLAKLDVGAGRPTE